MRLIPMERIAHQTLLGIRFWDRLLGRPVADGLIVQAQRLTPDRSRRVGRTVSGYFTPSRVIAFNGLHPGERVPADPALQIWETVPPQRLIAVDVIDRHRRYLPMSFVVRIPLDQPGVFAGSGAWLGAPLLHPAVSAGNEPGVYLWSAPTRPTPNGLAEIRTQVVVGDGSNPAPAAYAVVTATQTGAPAATALRYTGITDANGILALLLPYPPVPDPANPGDPYPVLQAQSFPLAIRVFYEPTSLTRLPGSDVPNLETILMQAQARIGRFWNNAAPPVLQTSLTLSKSLLYGQPLILRTAIGSASSAQAESFLRIQPV